MKADLWVCLFIFCSEPNKKWYDRRKNKRRVAPAGGQTLGRARKPEEDKTMTITINLKRKIIDKIALEGKPKTVIEKIVNDIYEKK